LNLHPHHARWFGRAIAPGERRPECNRNLTEDRSRNTPAKRALDPIECLYDFNFAGDNQKERTLSTFVDRKLAGGELEVGRRSREALQIGHRQCNGIAATSSTVSIAPPNLTLFCRPCSIASQARSSRPLMPVKLDEWQLNGSNVRSGLWISIAPANRTSPGAKSTAFHEPLIPADEISRRKARLLGRALVQWLAPSPSYSQECA
jgi:hypothetical protein